MSTDSLTTVLGIVTATAGAVEAYLLSATPADKYVTAKLALGCAAYVSHTLQGYLTKGIVSAATKPTGEDVQKS